MKNGWVQAELYTNLFQPPISEITDQDCSRSSHTQMRVKFKKSRQMATHKLSILHDPGLFLHPRYTMKISIKENFRKQAFWAPCEMILRGYFADTSPFSRGHCWQSTALSSLSWSVRKITRSGPVTHKTRYYHNISIIITSSTRPFVLKLLRDKL